MEEERNLAIESLPQVQEWIPTWKALKPEDLELTRLTGITNRTYRVRHKQEIQPKTILLRVFGCDVDDIFIDRKEETLVYQEVSHNNLGPKIYGYTKQFRAEEWIDSRVLQAQEMNKQYFRRKVALLLNKFHKQKIQDVCKIPLPLKTFEQRSGIKAALEKVESHKAKFTESEQKRIDEILNLWNSEKEIEFLKSKLPKSQESIVFSHNDLLANNVLINEESKKFFFIDFEYSCYNYRTFDIANYFVESQYDYEVKETPFYHVDPEMIDMDMVKDFIKYYAFADLYDVNKVEDIEKFVADESILESMIEDKAKYQALVDDMIQELPLFIMFSSYYWGFWAIVMSKNPDIDFDYIDFAYSRFTKYQQVKQKYFQA